MVGGGGAGFLHWCAAHRCVAVTLCTGSGPPRRHPSPDSYPLESECSPLADHPGARRLLVWSPHGQRDPVLPHIIHAEQLRAAECPAWSSCRLEQLSPGAAVAWSSCRLEQLSPGAAVAWSRWRLFQIVQAADVFVASERTPTR
jgi:hypothetical protein